MADAEAYREAVEQGRRRQETLVEWAEQHGLKLSEAGCCPLWLQRKVSRRCRIDSSACTVYGCHTQALDHHWLDHATTWLKDGRPAVVASSPYSVSDEDEKRLSFWMAADPRFRVARGDGWYGWGTTQLILWRSDRIGYVNAA
jgi:hypothetical protein